MSPTVFETVSMSEVVVAVEEAVSSVVVEVVVAISSVVVAVDEAVSSVVVAVEVASGRSVFDEVAEKEMMSSTSILLPSMIPRAMMVSPTLMSDRARSAGLSSLVLIVFRLVKSA